VNDWAKLISAMAMTPMSKTTAFEIPRGMGERLLRWVDLGNFGETGHFQ
jgi:hypothetical protein